MLWLGDGGLGWGGYRDPYMQCKIFGKLLPEITWKTDQVSTKPIALGENKKLTVLWLLGLYL